MRLSRLGAAAAAAALAIVPIAVFAAPAGAETTIDDVTFYGSSDFGQESAGYPAGSDWFFGEVSGTEGVHSFGVNGLALNADLSGAVQILNQATGGTPADVAAFIELLEGVGIYSTDASWTFQLPIYAEPGATGFTTLRPSVQAGQGGGGAEYLLDLDSDWITSQAIAPTYAAGAAAPLEDLLAAVYANGTPTLLAYGFQVNPADDATIQAIEWNDRFSAFTPVLSRTFPSTITIDEATTTGIPLFLGGVLPGTSIYLELLDPDLNPVFTDYVTPIGPDGTFSYHVVLPADAPLGTYELTFDDDGYGYSFLGLLPPDQPIQVTVTPPAEVLPATGGEAGTLGLIVAVMVIGGVALLVVARRRATA